MIKKRYPTRSDRGAFLDKLRKISGKEMVGLALVAVASLAPRCGGVIEGHVTRNSHITKNEARIALSTTRGMDGTGASCDKTADVKHLQHLDRGTGR